MHPLSLLVVLSSGVLMGGWTYQALADTEILSVVHAPPLSQGAEINSPQTDAAFTDSPITVSGNCPDNSYVNIYDNNNFGGVAWCSAAGNWQIVTDLYSGQNNLLAQDFNATDDQGPATPAIEVSYTPPALVFEQPSQISSLSPGTEVITPSYTALEVATNFNYQVFSAGSNYSWTIQVGGGVRPYKVLVNWGDANTTTVNLAAGPSLTIEHKYKTPGYYPVIVNITDAKYQKRTIQLAALIAPADAGGTINFNNQPKSPAHSSLPAPAAVTKTKTLLYVAWPAYAVIILMLVSFWFGERKEYTKLFKHRHPTTRG
jgi:hypothetical protein